MIFAIRHGEREDSPGTGFLPHAMGIDPKLTAKGVQQAHLTGKYLAKLIDDSGTKPDKIYIYSSPFMRCLTTANAIRAALVEEKKEANVSKIRLTMGLFQELSCFKASQKPLQSLQIFNLQDYPKVQEIIPLDVFDLQTFKNQFGVPDFDGKTSFEVFVDKRFIKTYNQILQFHEAEIKAARELEKELIIICVTHFTGVNIFDMETKATSEVDSYIPAPYYCCVSQAILEQKEGVRILRRKRCSDKSHLADIL